MYICAYTDIDIYVQGYILKLDKRVEDTGRECSQGAGIEKQGPVRTSSEWLRHAFDSGYTHTPYSYDVFLFLCIHMRNRDLDRDLGCHHLAFTQI